VNETKIINSNRAMRKQLQSSRWVVEDE